MDSPTSTQGVGDLPVNGQSLSAEAGPAQATPRRKRWKSTGEHAGKDLVPAKIYRSTLHVAKILAACKQVPMSAYLHSLVRRDVLRHLIKFSN